MDELNKISSSSSVSIVGNLAINPTELSKQILKPEKVLEKESKQELKQNTPAPELSKVLSALNIMPIISDNLRFSYAREEHQLLVQIRDKKTDDLIRQYPSEEFLKRLRYYRDNIGVLFDQKA
jgi:flagellar protein FlaG